MQESIVIAMMCGMVGRRSKMEEHRRGKEGCGKRKKKRKAEL